MAKKPNEVEKANQAYKKSLGKGGNINNEDRPELPPKPKPGGKPKPVITTGKKTEPNENDGWTPQPFYGQGPPPADSVAPRGTKEWRQAVAARQAWAADQVWSHQVGSGANISDKNALAQFLSTIGIEDVQGGGRHLFNLIMGNLPESEGGGMNPDPNRDISWFLENQMPEWKQGVDRAIQGGHLVKDHETGLLFNPGRDPRNPEWYDTFGRRVPAPYAGPHHNSEEFRADQAQQQAEQTAQPIVHTNVAPLSVPNAPFNPSPWAMPAYVGNESYPSGTPKKPGQVITSPGSWPERPPSPPSTGKLTPIKSSGPWDEGAMGGLPGSSGLDPIPNRNITSRNTSRGRMRRDPWYSTRWNY